MINRKAKGTRGERELIKFFNEGGWSAIRSAGSGSSRYPSPDILAGNALRRVAIECKMTQEQKKYLQKDEIDQLQSFAQKFGAEAWIGIRFPDEPWYFVMIEDLEKTGTCFAISLEQARFKGIKMEELMEFGQIKSENVSKE